MESTRKSALKNNDTHYFTGKPCIAGHIAIRRASNGNCVLCEQEKNNSSVRKEYMVEYSKANKDSIRQNASRYQKNNKGKVNARTAYRHTMKMQRTPTWLSKEQLLQIETEYRLAQWCSTVMDTSYHVDHIVPLQGSDVCGLHVPWNLQVIPATDNIRKSNNYNG